MGRSSALYLGGEGLKKILERQKRDGKEAKVFIFILFEGIVPFAEIRASFPQESCSERNKGKGRVSAMSRQN